MKIRLIDPRNKRLKNKIATYNSENHTWTIGKSKKVYQACFDYRYWVKKGEQKNPEISRYFERSGGVKGAGVSPIKELEDFKIKLHKNAPTNWRDCTESIYHSAKFFDKSKKANGMWVDEFEVLEYSKEILEYSKEVVERGNMGKEYPAYTPLPTKSEEEELEANWLRLCGEES